MGFWCHLLENYGAYYTVTSNYIVLYRWSPLKLQIVFSPSLCLGVSVRPQMWGYQVEHGAVFSPTFL
jgi:hypothetical protein